MLHNDVSLLLDSLAEDDVTEEELQALMAQVATTAAAVEAAQARLAEADDEFGHSQIDQQGFPIIVNGNAPEIWA